jgi:hypothetical protein
VPDTLLIKQHELGLDTTDIVVLLNLTSFWWFRDAPPFPRTNVIASRMGVTTRTVQRSLKKMEAKGYIRRGDFKNTAGNVMPAVYFEGLIERLGALAKQDPTLSMRLLRSAEADPVSGGDEIPF